MQPRHLLARDGEQAEGVVVAQVGLHREREAGEVGGAVDEKARTGCLAGTARDPTVFAGPGRLREMFEREPGTYLLTDFLVRSFRRSVLAELGLAPSRAEAERLIKQGGVEINAERVADVKKELDLAQPAEYLLRAGKKKFLKLIVE